MIVYTLKSCDTCKKAIKWLDAEGIGYENRDVRESPPSSETLSTIVKVLGAEKAVNKRSTTWRGLSDADKAGLDETNAVRLIAENPTLMKRPVFMLAEDILAGFDDSVRERLRV